MMKRLPFQPFFVTTRPTEVFGTQNTRCLSRLAGLLVSLAALLAGLLWLAPHAHADNYEETIDRLSRLQKLAVEYNKNEDPYTDPMILTLAYTRVGEYNTTMWQLVAGARDADFENYVSERDGDCSRLQGVGSMALPTGEEIDFSHLLASINLVYAGMPITGSWGGDCMQLAQVYQGQAGDVDGYCSLMQQTFNIPDDGTLSKFGDQDLRADLDSVVLGSQLKKDTDLTQLLNDYYGGLTNRDRVYDFVALSFGTVDTGDRANFRTKVYNTLLKDAGMQLLLYMNGMWQATGWTIAPEYETSMQGAAYLFADYLSDTLGGEKVRADDLSFRMTTMASQALADALNTLGDSEAAKEALKAAETAAEAVTSTGDKLADATIQVKSRFDAKIFQLVLLVIAAASLLGLIINLVLFILEGRR